MPSVSHLPVPSLCCPWSGSNLMALGHSLVSHTIDRFCLLGTFSSWCSSFNSDYSLLVFFVGVSFFVHIPVCGSTVSCTYKHTISSHSMLCTRWPGSENLPSPPAGPYDLEPVIQLSLPWFLFFSMWVIVMPISKMFFRLNMIIYVTYFERCLAYSKH